MWSYLILFNLLYHIKYVTWMYTNNHMWKCENLAKLKFKKTKNLKNLTTLFFLEKVLNVFKQLKFLFYFWTIFQNIFFNFRLSNTKFTLFLDILLNIWQSCRYFITYYLSLNTSNDCQCKHILQKGIQSTQNF